LITRIMLQKTYIVCNNSAQCDFEVTFQYSTAPNINQISVQSKSDRDQISCSRGKKGKPLEDFLLFFRVGRWIRPRRLKMRAEMPRSPCQMTVAFVWF
jgi:hypothetical protein